MTLYRHIRRIWRSAVYTVLTAVLFLQPSPVRAQEAPLSVDLQLSLLMKVMTFDRKFASRPGDEVVIGVVYQSRYRASNDAGELALQYVGTHPLTIGKKRVRAVALDLDNLPPGSMSRGSEVSILYITPLRSYSVEELVSIASETGMVTSTGVPEYVETGIAVGFDLIGDKPRILINLGSARNEGCDFDSQLLKLARVIR